MSDGPWFPLYPERFLASRRVRSMDATDLGIYMGLLLDEWMEGGPLPDNDRDLELSGRAPIEDVRRVLDLCFDLTPDGWSNPAMEEIRKEQLTKLMQARSAGKKGADQRWGKKRPPKNKENDSDPIATLKPPHSGPDRVAIGVEGEGEGEGDKKRREKKEKPPPLPPYENDFLFFWEAYPNKIGKKKALEKYQATRRKGFSHSDIMEGLDRYLKFKAANGQELHNPATFLGPQELHTEPWTIPEAATAKEKGNGTPALLDPHFKKPFHPIIEPRKPHAAPKAKPGNIQSAVGHFLEGTK